MNNLIEDLYEIFSKYKIIGTITGCHCKLCINPELENFYLNTPLLSLTVNDLSPYIHSVDIIDESCNDFRYFLPRILEIIFETKEHSHLFFDSIWGILAKPNYDTWPSRETCILDKFFMHYYKTVDEAVTDHRKSYIVEELKEAGFWKDSFLNE